VLTTENLKSPSINFVGFRDVIRILLLTFKKGAYSCSWETSLRAIWDIAIKAYTMLPGTQC